jgi:hypothetical protein
MVRPSIEKKKPKGGPLVPKFPFPLQTSGFFAFPLQRFVNWRRTTDRKGNKGMVLEEGFTWPDFNKKRKKIKRKIKINFQKILKSRKNKKEEC